jgi:hypothetical protein
MGKKKKHKPNGQEPIQKSPSRFVYSPELKRICLINEAGEIVNSTEEEPEGPITIGDMNVD